MNSSAHAFQIADSVVAVASALLMVAFIYFTFFRRRKK